MNKEINTLNGIFKNEIYSIVNQLVYILFITNMSNVFVTIFAGKGQKIAPKTNSLSLLTPGLKPGAINIQPLWGWCMPPFFLHSSWVGVCLPPFYWWVPDHTNIKTPFF